MAFLLKSIRCGATLDRVLVRTFKSRSDRTLEMPAAISLPGRRFELSDAHPYTPNSRPTSPGYFCGIAKGHCSAKRACTILGTGDCGAKRLAGWDRLMDGED